MEQHVQKYHEFTKTEEYKSLHNTIVGGSNQWYRDIIESVLFCYYLKFGSFYLSDALIVIMRILLQHRYTSTRALKASVVQYAGNSELVLIIDQATSPTFFFGRGEKYCQGIIISFTSKHVPYNAGYENESIKYIQEIGK